YAPRWRRRFAPPTSLGCWTLAPTYGAHAASQPRPRRACLRTLLGTAKGYECRSTGKSRLRVALPATARQRPDDRGSCCTATCDGEVVLAGQGVRIRCVLEDGLTL